MAAKGGEGGSEGDESRSLHEGVCFHGNPPPLFSAHLLKSSPPSTNVRLSLGTLVWGGGGWWRGFGRRGGGRAEQGGAGGGA